MENKQNQLSTAQVRSAYRFAKEQKNKAINEVKTKLSQLTNKLQILTGKSENEITKKDLLEVITLNFDYMRAYSLFRYNRVNFTGLSIESSHITYYQYRNTYQ